MDQVGPVDFAETAVKAKIIERFSPLEAGTFSALIPQEFNLEIETSGDIVGVNHGDSKLVAMVAVLVSKNGLVQIRRLRADTCRLEGEGVQALSSLEARSLYIKAGIKGFSVGKRLGLDADAVIESEGPIKIGSLFCLMRNLPEVTYATLAPTTPSPGVQIKCNADISIDNI